MGLLHPRPHTFNDSTMTKKSTFVIGLPTNNSPDLNAIDPTLRQQQQKTVDDLVAAAE
jgi:hypothetical protein